MKLIAILYKLKKVRNAKWQIGFTINFSNFIITKNGDSIPKEPYKIEEHPEILTTDLFWIQRELQSIINNK